MTEIIGDVANSISGGAFYGPVYQVFLRSFREALAAQELNAETVRRLSEIHEPPAGHEEILKGLAERHSVALVAGPGTGRRITAIAMLAQVGVPPHSVVLDSEDLQRPLPVKAGHGYLLDLEEARDQLTPEAGLWVADLAARARAVGAYLVLRIDLQGWHALALADPLIKAVELVPAPAISIFRSHLSHLASPVLAADWAGHEPIRRLLASARPPDAVRLAGIVRDVRDTAIPEPEQLEQVLDAYGNWADTLTRWFGLTQDQGHQRALLLAAAALEGAPAAAVCDAADKLAGMVELPRTPGAGLVGSGIQTLVSQIDAKLHHGRVLFARPSYGASVLDYVWRDRPQLHAALQDWLTELPGRDPETTRAARSLTELAIRQSEAGLVTRAANRWAHTPSLRELAIGALTAAAVSEQVGRSVRRRMYLWARQASASEDLHLVIAAVCAGELAQAFPKIALTRLRHLAVRESEHVRDATIEALARLAMQSSELLQTVIGEVADWIQSDGPRAEVGRRAFLRLAGLRDTEGLAILPAAAQSEDHLDCLAEMWRDVLRRQMADHAAQNLAVSWLEAAAQDRAPRQMVIEVFTRTCHSSFDLGILTQVVIGWLRTADSPAPASRDEIGLALLHRAQERDQLGTTTPYTREEA